MQPGTARHDCVCVKVPTKTFCPMAGPVVWAVRHQRVHPIPQRSRQRLGTVLALGHPLCATGAPLLARWTGHCC